MHHSRHGQGGLLTSAKATPTGLDPDGQQPAPVSPPLWGDEAPRASDALPVALLAAPTDLPNPSGPVFTPRSMASSMALQMAAHGPQLKVPQLHRLGLPSTEEDMSVTSVTPGPVDTPVAVDTPGTEADPSEWMTLPLFTPRDVPGADGAPPMFTPRTQMQRGVNGVPAPVFTPRSQPPSGTTPVFTPRSQAVTPRSTRLRPTIDGEGPPARPVTRPVFSHRGATNKPAALQSAAVFPSPPPAAGGEAAVADGLPASCAIAEPVEPPAGGGPNEEPSHDSTPAAEGRPFHKTSSTHGELASFPLDTSGDTSRGEVAAESGGDITPRTAALIDGEAKSQALIDEMLARDLQSAQLPHACGMAWHGTCHMTHGMAWHMAEHELTSCALTTRPAVCVRARFRILTRHALHYSIACPSTLHPAGVAGQAPGQAPGRASRQVWGSWSWATWASLGLPRTSLRPRSGDLWRWSEIEEIRRRCALPTWIDLACTSSHLILKAFSLL